MSIDSREELKEKLLSAGFTEHEILAIERLYKPYITAYTQKSNNLARLDELNKIDDYVEENGTFWMPKYFNKRLRELSKEDNHHD